MVFIRTKISPAERIDSKDIFKKILEEGKKKSKPVFWSERKKKIPIPMTCLFSHKQGGS